MSSSPFLPPILVADDESADVHSLRRALLSLGVRNPIIGVADGEELLRFLDSATFGGLIPRILFLDVRMPGMSGLEALDAIRAHPQLSDLRVVVMTNLTNDADRERARAQGAEYVLKFPTPTELGVLLHGLEAEIEITLTGTS
jgi:CheY-like chemotaxis protein